ncbi:major facilitator superfamily-domain-containing protein [Mycena latifolia]|nr:major facilitator superfamily-domain-containing protein [Mycena latifolia]
MSTPPTDENKTLSSKELNESTSPSPGDVIQVHEFPHGIRLALLTLALILSIFLVALDNTILSVAIPQITDHFKSLDDVGWYGSAYLLSTASTQLLYGKLYTSFPIKAVYIWAITVFEVGSLICAVAPTSNTLIVGRAIAGLGNSGIFSGAFIIIAHSVELEKRSLYTAIITGCYGLGGILGPVVGGALTDKVTWRWCFYINLPFGAVTLFVMLFFFHIPKGGDPDNQPVSLRDRLNRLDYWGTVAFIPAIVSLLLALQWGGSKFPWRSARIVALFVVFAVCIAIFMGIQLWKQEGATVPPRIFRKRSIWAGTWFSLCIGSSFFVFVFYLQIWFQAIKGVNAVTSGIYGLPRVICLVIGSILSGVGTKRFGYYTPFMIFSSILITLGSGLFSTFRSNTSPSRWIGYQIIYGLGLGFGMQQPVIAAQTVLELSDVPIGTALMMFAQTLGGCVFVSVAQSVFTNSLVSGLASTVPGVNSTFVLAIGATDLKTAVDPQYLPAVQTVYNQALISAFYVALSTACLSLAGSLLVEWKSVKRESR